MKTYQTPETKSLKVNAQTVICASAEAPMRQAPQTTGLYK